jgi:hypothetical protein
MDEITDLPQVTDKLFDNNIKWVYFIIRINVDKLTCVNTRVMYTCIKDKITLVVRYNIRFPLVSFGVI